MIDYPENGHGYRNGKRLRVGIIGAGVFGGHHGRKVHANPAAMVSGIYDPVHSRAEGLAKTLGEARSVTDLAELLALSDAVIVASPATTHGEIVATALAERKHVLVEKPLVPTGALAHELSATARGRNLVLQVGHQERFVFEAMGLLDIGETPKRIEAVRACEPSPDGRCEDVSVVQDLMIHDIDLVAALLGYELKVVNVRGMASRTRFLDEVMVELRCKNGSARLSATRNARNKRRTMRIVYPSGTVDIDFCARKVRNSSPFRILADVSSVLPDPLKTADDAFIDACLGGGRTPIPGLAGARASAIAEDVERAASRPPTARLLRRQHRPPQLSGVVIPGSI